MGLISRNVYSPAEDSWLLEECILREDLRAKKCLDLGCGSGIQTIAMLEAGAEKVFALDINECALISTQKRLKKFFSEQKRVKTKPKNLGFSLMNFFGENKTTPFFGDISDLVVGVKSNLFSEVNEKFDFIAFNPPYVPSDEVKWIDLDGGVDGREVIDKFLLQVKPHLHKKGVLLLLVSSLNLPDDIISILKKQGFEVSVAGRKKLFFEELLVLRAVLK